MSRLSGSGMYFSNVSFQTWSNCDTSTCKSCAIQMYAYTLYTCMQSHTQDVWWTENRLFICYVDFAYYQLRRLIHFWKSNLVILDQVKINCMFFIITMIKCQMKWQFNWQWNGYLKIQKWNLYISLNIKTVINSSWIQTTILKKRGFVKFKMGFPLLISVPKFTNYRFQDKNFVRLYFFQDFIKCISKNNYNLC